MAMNVGPAEGDEDEVISTINTTPLVDVMLVLLIIFLITVPVVTTSIQLQLPKERNEIRETKPENITLSVDRQGRIYWNNLLHPHHRGIDRPPEEDLGHAPAARGADPGRRQGGLRGRGQGDLRLPARRDRENRLHHRAPRARRLTAERAKESAWP